jgi:hypothetical protein
MSENFKKIKKGKACKVKEIKTNLLHFWLSAATPLCQTATTLCQPQAN